MVPSVEIDVKHNHASCGKAGQEKPENKIKIDKIDKILKINLFKVKLVTIKNAKSKTN